MTCQTSFPLVKDCTEPPLVNTRCAFMDTLYVMFLIGFLLKNEKDC